jgi:DnaD/phage-associated family protein
MAGYRQFHTQFWKDDWVIDLDPLERYLFCYLFTNELSSISGLYKLPMRVIINETGLDQEFIEAAFRKFQAAQRILYADGVMWVVNMAKFHRNASPKTMTKVKADVNMVPDCTAKKAYLYHAATQKYPTDTVSIPIPESVSVNKDKAEAEAKGEPKPKAPEPLPLPERPLVYALYEREIGVLTPMISDALRDAEKTFPIEWFEPAMKEAVDHNVRNWKYVETILKRWKVDGFQSVKGKPNGRGPLSEDQKLEIAQQALYGSGNGISP